MMEVCQDYINKYDSVGWLYIGGQVGSGKTHIATATLQELMKRSNVGSIQTMARNCQRA
jgi:DNA replication protein DnaC